jgi:hypothetical protein
MKPDTFRPAGEAAKRVLEELRRKMAERKK